MVIFLFGTALKEEENELSDDDLACGALALGRFTGEEGLVGAVSWLPWLTDLSSWLCSLRNHSENTRHLGLWAFSDVGGNVRGK